MRIIKSKLFGCAVAAGLLGSASLAVMALNPLTASAATSGAATAQGVSVNLNASLGGIAIINAQSVVGNVASPPSSSQTALSLSSASGLGTVGSGLVTVTATTTDALSEGTAQITGLNYSVLGTPLLQGTGSVISSDSSCPTGGQPTATTNLAGLNVLGSAVTLSANSPAVTVSSAVNALPAIPGLTNATLSAQVSSVAQTTSTSANATAVLVNVSLNATILGVTTSEPVGTITLAATTCSAAAPATTTSTTTPPSSTTGTTGAAGTTGATGSTTPSSPTGTGATTSPGGAATTTPLGGATTPASASTAPSSGPRTLPLPENRASSSTPEAAAVPGSPVLEATSVHTGEPWAGSWPFVVALLIAGMALVTAGETARRRNLRPIKSSR